MIQVILLSIMAAALPLAAMAGTARNPKPNIVIILADDLGWSDTTLFGQTKFYETPNIERLASRGMLFRNACAVIWPGKVRPGAASDALLSSTDFYPTLLEMLGLKPQPGQHFDGFSQVPALLGRRPLRQAAYCFFPHYTPATGNIPGAWVRRGDWKLIRFFCDGPGQADRVELYNLREDIGETKDLAAANPQTVKQLDARLSAYLRDTRAILPEPNPSYRPDAKLHDPRERRARPAKR